MSYADPRLEAKAYEAESHAKYLDGLLDRLTAKLAELEAKGFRIRWIEVGGDELVRLFEEGGDEVIVLDPDPTCDLAWFGRHEVRPSPSAGLFVYLDGEYDQTSCHCV